MKFQILFYRYIRKQFKISSAEILPSMQSVKHQQCENIPNQIDRKFHLQKLQIFR